MRKLWNKIKQGWKWVVGFLIGVTAVASVATYGDKPAEPIVSPTIPIVQTTPTYFAEINKGGVVLRVIVADQDFINSGKVGDPKNWVQTTTDGSLRKNYAGIGYTYDKRRNVFVPPKGKNATIFNEGTARWEEPLIPSISMP